MNTATESLEAGAPSGLNPANCDFAPCPGCGYPEGLRTWNDDSLGGGDLLFETRKLKWWRFQQYSTGIPLPNCLHFCLRCGLLWGKIDLKDATTKVTNFGSERLHQKLGWLKTPTA